MGENVVTGRGLEGGLWDQGRNHLIELVIWLNFQFVEIKYVLHYDSCTVLFLYFSKSIYREFKINGLKSFLKRKFEWSLAYPI